MERKSVRLGNGTTISYLERAGGSEPLVLLHGITDHALTYAPFENRIDPRYHVFALDHRGHGHSDKPDTHYDTEAYADDVRHFIREVAGGCVLLEGHSLGGAVAVQVGATAPELVRGLVLEDPPLYFVNDLNETYRALFEGIVMMSTTLQEGSQTEDDWFAVMAQAPDPYSGKPGIETMGEAKIRERLTSIGQMKPKALQDALAGSLKWDTDAVLAKIRCPVLLLSGDAAIGAVMTGDEIARAESVIGECRSVIAPAVGHLIHDQAPDVWLAAVNDWPA